MTLYLGISYVKSMYAKEILKFQIILGIVVLHDLILVTFVYVT